MTPRSKLYSLEILRNTFRSAGNENENPETPPRQHFYLFDYFDRLACVTEVGYQEHFGSSSQKKTALSKQHITLQATDEEGQDPFHYVDRTGQKPYPYLFCIFVQLFPADQVDEVEESFDIANNVVNALRKIAGETLPEGMPYAIYHQFNVGDFCLALRTDDVQAGYRLANAVRTYDLGHGVVMDTYTIVGIEKPCENQFSANGDHHSVVLRLSIRNMSALKSLNALHTKDGAPAVELKGLTGRYDVTLTLTLSQFQQIYPFLWKRKFIKQDAAGTAGTPKERKNGDGISDPVVRWFCQNLQEIEFINERLLITLPKDSFREAQSQTLDVDKTTRQNDCIRESFERLKNWKFRLENWEFADGFRRSLRRLEDVWDSFSDLRYQRDACINGNMFFAQMYLALRCIEEQLRALEADPPEKDSRKRGKSESRAYHAKRKLLTQGFQDLDAWISKAGASMHNFNFRLQAINQQSLQAPIYECQMQMDPGKYLVAYTEFARLFLTQWSKQPTPQQKVLPFFSIDFNQAEPSADPLFLMPYLYRKEQNALVSSEKEERLLLAINIPDTDNLAQIYDMVPLITHELSHNLRILDRGKRNRELADFVFAQTASYVVRHIMARNSSFERCFSPDSLTKTLIDSLHELLREKFEQEFGGLLKEQNIGALISTLQQYLRSNLVCFCEELRDNSIYVDIKDAKKAMTEMLSLLSPEGRNSLSFEPIPDDNWQQEHTKWAKRILQALAEQIKAELESARPEGEKPLPFPSADEYGLPSAKLDLRLQECFAEMNQWYQNLPTRKRREYAQSETLWRSCCMRLKDMNYRYEIIRQSQVYGRDGESREEAGRRFLEEWFERLRRRLTDAKPKDQALWRSGAPSGHLNRLGLLMSDPDVFVRAVKRALQTMPGEVFDLIIDESVTAYREIFADLGMCAFCKFDAFGYLRFFSHKHKIAFTEGELGAGNILYYANTDMSTQRILTVGAVLLKAHGNHDTAWKWLKDKALEYLQSAERRLSGFALSKSLKTMLGNWIGDLKVLLERKDKDRLEQFAPSWLPEFCESPEDRTFINNYFQALEELYELVKQVLCVCYLISKDGFGTESQLVDHFAGLYAKLTDMFSRNCDCGDLLQEIPEFYNGSKFTLREKQAQDEFRKVLEFTQQYYYKNWNVYAYTPNLRENTKHDEAVCRQNQQAMDAWISKLIDPKE